MSAVRKHDYPGIGNQVVASVDGAAAALAESDRVFIGAGAGISAAAGFDYTDPVSFAHLFPALTQAGFSARYQLIGYPLPPRHQWGFWAIHVNDIRLGQARSVLYQDLRRAVGDRSHFVLTSNVDALFARNGFDGGRVYTPQGDYALYQCLTPCTREVWDVREIIADCLSTLDAATGEVAEESVPSCPNCCGPVYLNVHAGPWFIADHFQAQTRAMSQWLREAQAAGRAGGRLAVIDAGSGYNTPGVVRWPAEQIVRAVPGSTLIRINRDDPEVPADLSDRAFSLSGDASAIVARLGAFTPTHNAAPNRAEHQEES